MATTARYAFPYQVASDAPAGNTLGQNLAEAVETKLGIVEDAKTAADTALDVRLDVIEGKPIGRIVQTVAQVLTDAAYVAITFTGTDTYDTSNAHDPASNPSRVTPTVAGYYRFTGTVWFATATTPVRTSIQWRVNSSAGATGPVIEDAFNGRQHSSPMSTAIIAFNGTTDYVELMALQDSSGNINTFVSGQVASILEWEWLRPL